MDFVEGLFVKRRETAPEFVKANLSFNAKFLKYYEDNKNEKGYLNLDILESKEGKLYAKLDTWKPKGQTPPKDEDVPPLKPKDEDGLPF